tara:strand:+ start:4815 stop:5129 length:315 start_codon:yes stop_codon:yes gene_type:complete
MKVEFDDTEQEVEKNPTLQEPVVRDTELKEMIVNYVGQKKNPDDGLVTLEMVLEVMAEDFSDFVMPIAEENWIRGYKQALSDVEEGERMAREEAEATTSQEEDE